MEDINMSKSLELYIDKPLRKTIAALNLLGIKTGWCCCGYDYTGQPKWKKHEDNLFISLELGENAMTLVHAVLKHKIPFTVGSYVMQDGIENRTKYIQLLANLGPYKDHVWQDKDCAYYFELKSQAIHSFESYLIKYFKEAFVKEIIITDSNHVINKTNPYWETGEHSTKEDWIVTPAYLDKPYEEFEW